MNTGNGNLKDRISPKRILGNDSGSTGLTKADALLQQIVSAEKFPGIALTVLKDGETIFQKGYGLEDIDQETLVNPQRTIFRVASVSKPIAATALAFMVQDGIIDLDMSFYEYVPYYPKKRWDFTLRQLAGHAAGIRGYKGKEYGLNEPYSIKESLVFFQDDALLFQPGKGFLYNTLGWVLISLAMQEASGVPFDKYVQEKVLEPIGMSNTFAPQCNPQHTKGNGLKATKQGYKVAKQANVATFYTKGQGVFRKAIPVNNCYKLAGGGYLSTSGDIAKLGQAHLDNILLKKEVRDQFLTTQKVNGKSTHYGLGWQVSKDAKGRKFYGHVGNGVGGYSNFFIYPEERLVISMLINCTDPKVQEELDAVINCFFD